MYDLVIIGGGPAGVSAGVYASRKKIKTCLITDMFGGQSIVSDNIENWVGEKSISGFDLAQKLESHLASQTGLEIVKGELASSIEDKKSFFSVRTSKGKIFETRTILIVSGSRRRKLGVPGEKEFEGRGVAYCSTCDTPLFKDKKVAVVGGGNAGLEAAIDLLTYASKIYVLEYLDNLKGDPITAAKLKDFPKVEIITSARITEIIGDKMVKALKYEDRKTGVIREIEVEGVFVEIGIVPNSDFVKNLVEVNKQGEIVVDPRNGRSSRLGIWAAGDVTDCLYRQNNIAAGDGVKAALDIYDYLASQSPQSS